MWQLNLRVDAFVLAAILGEVIWIVCVPGAGALTTSAKVTQLLAKLRTADKFNDLRQELQRVGQLDEVLGAAGQGGRIERAVADIATTRMCFVAGTLVVTDAGPMPIECVEVGDWVWSRDEQTGQEAYRAVVDTIVTRPRVLVQLTVDCGGGTQQTFTGTAEHPFYVLGRKSFVPMGELQPGNALLRAGGAAAAYVTDVQVMRGPPRGEANADVRALHPLGWDDQGFTTFNLEVDGFHTYFVGDGGGVWVHNDASRACEQLFEIFSKVKARNPGMNSWQAWEATLLKIDTINAGDRFDGRAIVGACHKVMDDIYASATTGGVDPSQVPSVAEMRRVMRGRLTDTINDPGRDLGLETNHIVSMEWFKVLFQRRYGRAATTPEIDAMPGLIMPRILHNNNVGPPGVATFHDILQRELRVRPREDPDFYTNRQILGAFDSAYLTFNNQFGGTASFDYARVSAVGRRWLLNEHGILP